MKRQPIPINASGSGESLKKEIDRARNSTYLFINSGPCCAVKIANTNFDKEVIVENIIKGMENIAKMIPKHWRNIQPIHIKTSNSVALPIYNSLPNATMKILSNKKKVNQPINSQETVTEMETEDIDLKARDKKRKLNAVDTKDEARKPKKQKQTETKTIKETKIVESENTDKLQAEKKENEKPKSDTPVKRVLKPAVTKPVPKPKVIIKAPPKNSTKVIAKNTEEKKRNETKIYQSNQN